MKHLIRHSIKQTTQLLILLISMTIFSITAATESTPIPISSFISTGTGDSYTESNPNIWFLLDNSSSMEIKCTPGIQQDCTEFYSLGFINYDPAITYILPKRINGDDMPLPLQDDYAYFYAHPFIDDSQNIAFAKLQTRTLQQTWDQGPIWNWSYNDINSTCWDQPQEQRRNCEIWRNYYSSRMRVLKSALSLSLLNNNRAKKLRIGYSSLNENSNQSDNNLPVLPLHGPNAASNKAQFNQWLYRLSSTGQTPIRKKLSTLFSDVIDRATQTSGQAGLENPLLKIPGTAHDSITNPVQFCRRNYAVVLTDGAWNQTSNSFVNNNMSNPNHIKNRTTEQSDVLPDGTQYTARSPYQKQYRPASDTGYNPKTLADISFAGWKTDIDNDASNNDLLAQNIKINDAVQQLHGSSYWHPYNDPATWQHINTFTIGFGLEGNPQINPPNNSSVGIDPTYLANNYYWPIELKESGTRVEVNDAVNDLANAALAGRGLFYNVRTSSDLKKAFDEIIRRATKLRSKTNIKGSSGFAGFGQGTGLAHYSTQYDLNSFTGQLIKTKLYNGDTAAANLINCFGTSTGEYQYGQLCTNTSAITNAQTSLSTNTNRKIISLKRTKNNNSGTLDYEQYTTGQNINSSQLRYQQIPLAQNQMNPAMRTRLINNFPPVISENFSDNTERLNKLVNYSKGDIEQENTNLFRKRQTISDLGITTRNILGVTVRSSPTLSGVPSISNLHPDFLSENYTNFVKRYLYQKDSNGGYLTSLCNDGCSSPIAAEYVNMVYVGANDGMLHAFRADNLEEVFAYVPNAVYDNLPNLVEPGAQQSLVDGGINIQTINVANGTSNTWKKVLVGAMGGGGKGVYALDVTDSTAANLAKWEYSDFESKLYQKNQTLAANFTGLKSNIGNIVAKPATIQLSDGTWAVVIGNGYNSENNKAALIVINADTGQPIQELVLDNDYTDNDQPNGLGPLYFAAYPNKSTQMANRVDRAYAGDLQGNLWVFDLTSATQNGGIKIAKQNPTASEKPLFVAQYNHNGQLVKQPITVAPLVKMHPSQYGYLVHFGTGSLFSENDLSSNIKNTIYAIWDDWVPSDHNGLPSPRTGNVVSRNDLRAVELVNLAGEDVTLDNGETVNIGQLKPNTPPIKWAYNGSSFSQKKRGWYLDLLMGERAWQPAFNTFGSENIEGISYNTVRYESATSVNSLCSTAESTVINRRMVFNPNDGTQNLPAYGTLDLNKNGKTSVDDLITTTSTTGETTKQVAMLQKTSGTILFNSIVSNIYSAPTAPQNAQLCHYKTEIVEVTDGSLLAKQVCRRSYSGSWTELK